MDKPIDTTETLLHHPEGVDLLPASIELSGMEVSLVNAMSRETILRQVLEFFKKRYDYILIDCMPSLGMLTVNALAAGRQRDWSLCGAISACEGTGTALKTIGKVQRQINQSSGSMESC